MKKRLLSIFLAIATVVGMLGVPITYAEETAELFSSATSVIYVSESGAIDGISQENIRTNISAALTKVGDSEAVIYISGDVTLPLDIGDPEKTEGKITFRGHEGTSDRLLISMGTTKICRDVTFENISVKPCKIDERWLAAQDCTVTFADSCVTELSDEYTYNGKQVKTGLYIGAAYAFDGDQHYVMEDGDATITMLAPLTGYSGSHIVNGNATFDLKAGTYSAVYGVARNGASSGKYQTLNGDVRYNISGGTYGGLVSGSLNGGSINGNILFDITGGKYAAGATFYLGNRNICNSAKTQYYADCTKLGNTALVFNAKELSTCASTVSNLKIQEQTDFADLERGTAAIIFNNAEIEGYFPTVSTTSAEYLIKVYNGKAYPVYAETASGTAGELLGFEFTPDNEGYAPFADGIALKKNEAGYYDVPLSGGLFTNIYCRNPLDGMIYTATFMDNGTAVAGSITMEGNVTFELPLCVAKKEGYYFDGWKCGDNIYSTGESVIIDKNTEFNPVWTENSKKEAVYVCAMGSDTNEGFSQYAPKATFAEAAKAAQANSLDRIVVKSAITTGGNQLKMPAFSYPVTVTGEGFEGSLYIDNTFLAYSPITFENMGLACKRYQFFVTNGNDITFGEGLEKIDEKGIELHVGANYASAKKAICTVKSDIVDIMYLGGAYLKADGVGVAGDCVLNLENINDFSFIIGFDSYGDYVGIGSIGGNVFINMKNSHVKSIKTTLLSEIAGALIFVTDNNSLYPDESVLPEANCGRFFFKTTDDVIIRSAVDENGNVLPGVINATCDKENSKIRLSNSDISTVYPQGDITVLAGNYTIETVPGTVLSECDFEISAPVAGHTASDKIITHESYFSKVEWYNGNNKVSTFGANKEYTAKITTTLYNYVEASDELTFTVNGTVCDAVNEGNGVYTVNYTFPSTGALHAVYVSSTGSNSASGTKEAPFATIAKATNALAKTGGVIYVCDKVSAVGTYASNAYPILITGKGFEKAELELPKSNCFIAGGELIFEDLTITMGDTSHINDNGNKLTISDSVVLSTGKMFHFGSYAGKSIEKGEVYLGLQSYIGSFYVSGAYITKDTCNIEKDLFVTFNDTVVGTMHVAPDSYSASHMGLSLGGNVLITMNGDSSIKSVAKKTHEITYAEDSVYQFILSDRATIPDIAEDVIPSDMIYIVRSGIGGKVYHSFDENGKSISGSFDIIPDEGHMALIERMGTTILSEGGRYAFPAGEIVTVSYVKTDYALKQYKVDLDGGKAYDELFSIDAKGNITFIGVPVKAGNFFEGWYRDAERTELVKNGDHIGELCVLYAKYLPVSFDYTEEEFAVKGVQIRIPTDNKEQGLRYIVAVSRDALSQIADFSDKNATITTAVSDTVGYGAAVLPDDYLGGRRLENDSDYRLGDKVYRSKKVPAKMIYDTTDETVYFTVCITKIPVEKYERNYTVRPYISYYTRSGNFVTVYGDSYETGIISTAFEVLEKGGETDTERTYLRSNVLSVYAQNRGIELIPAEVLDSINEKTELYKENVVNSANIDTSKISGKIYYVSNSGSDTNDGLSPSTAWASIAKVNASTINSGDAVLFERGGEYRGKISAKQGVTYSAYGSGEKPIINGSAQDYADASMWTETLTNVYKLNQTISQDVGLIAFDHGREYGDYDAMFSTKRVSGVVYSGKTFVDQFDLERDLEFYHDPSDDTLYLYSSKGNPGERFSKIEIATRGNLIDVRVKNVTIDNLHIRYGGSHGVGGGGTAKYDADGNYVGLTSGAGNLKVTNCVFAWIGGSILNDKTRYGNAVEIFGSVDGYTVENNWIYQIYDTGITHQLSGTNCSNSMMQDIEYRDNLVEYCHWSIEFYNQPCCDDHKRIVRNVLAEDNILRMGGHGWGSRLRKTGATLYNSFGLSKVPEETENFHAKNNIFFRSTGPIYRLNANASERNLTFEGNTYVQDYSCYFSWYCGSHYAYKDVYDLVGDGLQIEDPNSEVYFYAP